MTVRQKQIIKETWQLVSKLDDKTVGALFYDRLFHIAPEVRALFLSSVPEQSKKLMAMLHYMVRHIDQPLEIGASLPSLATRHIKYNVKTTHYAIVGNALLWTLQQGLGTNWSDEAEEAWATFYIQVSQAMIAVHQQSQTVLS